MSTSATADAGRQGASTPVALVTGSSRGIGRAIAVELASAGYAVAVHYRANREAADEVVGACRAAAGPAASAAVAFAAEIGVTADRARLVDEVYAEYGRLDLLVNNAGIAPRERADMIFASEESMRELLAVNLEGPYALTQLVARRWLAEAERSPVDAGNAGSGSPGNTGERRSAGPAVTRSPSGLAAPRRAIVFVTSISAVTASTSRGEYCVSKAGLAMAASLFAARLADCGIDVFEVRPGIIRTDMTAGVTAKYDPLIADGLVPQRRWGESEDVGRAVRALVGGEFGFATGSVVHVDGGFHVQRL